MDDTTIGTPCPGVLNAREQARPPGGAIVCVHGLSQARLALRVAGDVGVAVTLISAPGAAGFAGCGWWRAVMAAAGCGDDLLDCGEAAGYAMAALRVGQKGLVLAAETPGLAAVLGAAAGEGARVVVGRPTAFDFGGAAETWALTKWLAGVTPAGGWSS